MIMATTNINVRVDTELKKAAEELFEDLGLNMTPAVTMFLKCAVSQEGIPFEIKRHTPNVRTAAALAEYEKMLSDPENYKRYDTFAELVDEVLADA